MKEESGRLNELLLSLRVDAEAAANNPLLPAAVKRAVTGSVTALELLAERVAAIEGRAVR